MSIRKDKMIIVDLEATCWDGYDAPPGQENEIIEIGVCTLDLRELTLVDKRSLLVRPECSEVSPYCTALTTITPELLVEQGIAFDLACSILEQDYDSRNRLWASWGHFDFRIFKDQCKRRGVRYPFSKKHGNLKRLFADVHGTRMGIARALDALSIEPEGTAHRGVDDAWNTGRLLLTLINQHGIDILRKYGI